MGPSKVFNLHESTIFIIVGLCLNGLFLAPVWINTLPQVYLNTQIKYKIVEKVNEEFDNYLAD